jgi:hypothetical protein
LQGYGVFLDIKNMEYKIDETDTKKEKDSEEEKEATDSEADNVRRYTFICIMYILNTFT